MSTPQQDTPAQTPTPKTDAIAFLAMAAQSNTPVVLKEDCATMEREYNQLRAQLAAERAIKAELVAALKAMDEVANYIDLSQGLRIGLIFSKQFAGAYAALSKARAQEDASK